VEAVPLRKRLGAPLEFGVTTETGDRLRVEVVRRLHRRGGPWYRLRRLLASLEVEDVRLSTPYHETEHEALVTLFAHRAGVSTPPVVLACETRHGAPLLVRRQVDGRPLAGMSSAEIDESLLDAIWAQIAALGEARIAHHDLRAQNILVDAHGTPWLLNFTVGVIGASYPRTAQDIAETLVSLASRVGVLRTVRSACRMLSPDRLEPALAYLQPLALPRRIRKQCRAAGRSRLQIESLVVHRLGVGTAARPGRCPTKDSRPGVAHPSTRSGVAVVGRESGLSRKVIEQEMGVERSVYDFSGVRIGTATADGVVRDHSGTRIGTANPDGVVLDFSNVRIGTLEQGRRGRPGPRP
jgi:hypothetical protein